jgi:type I restriction enzyme, S subunit
MTIISHVSVSDLVASGEAELTTGPFGTQLKACEYVEDGIPLINVRNIGFGDVRATDLEYLSEETALRLNRHRLEAGDIVFGRKGAVERHALISRDQVGWVQGSDCLRLRLRSPRFVPRFVSYFLLTEHHKQWMKNHCSGAATMASLNQEILGRIALPLVAKTTQRKVAAILSGYDDLIENNNRRIRFLEEMAQRVYQEWFVDFRYPGHENVPLTQTELGLDSKEWSVVGLGDVSTVYGGMAITKAAYVASGYRAYSAAGPDGYLADYKVDGAGVVISAVGARCGRTWLASGKWSSISNTLRIHPVEKLSTAVWLYFSTFGPDGWHKRGSAQPFIAINDVRARRLLLPPFPLIGRFTDYVSSMMLLIETLRATADRLQANRNLLIPPLLSGGLNVTDLEIAGLEKVG